MSHANQLEAGAIPSHAHRTRLRHLALQLLANCGHQILAPQQALILGGKNSNVPLNPEKRAA